MKDALYWTSKGEKLECMLCPNLCKISGGKKGYCQVRSNIDGKLIAETFNKYSSIALDPIEKKPLYHFYPGQPILSLGFIGCNFRCHHCQNWHISQPFRQGFERHLYSCEPLSIIEKTIESGATLIAFTYNEPTVNIETMLVVAELAKNKGLNTVIVTNGFISKQPLLDLIPLIDAFSIDLKSFTQKAYKTLTCVDSFEIVVKNIEIVLEHNKHIELVTNLVTDINNDIFQLESAAKWIASLDTFIPWHISSFFPTLDYSDKEYVSSSFIQEATIMAKEIGLQNVYSRFSEHTNCPSCGDLLIKRSRFNVLENRVFENKCSKCGRVIPRMVNLDEYKSCNRG